MTSIQITMNPFVGTKAELISFMNSVFSDCLYAEEVGISVDVYVDNLHIIQVGGIPVGYVTIRNVKGSQIHRLDEEEDMDLLIHVDPDGQYTLVDYLEILDTHRGQGIGRAVVLEILKNAKHRIVLYSTGSSQEFWWKVGFDTVGLSNWWMWNL